MDRNYNSKETIKKFNHIGKQGTLNISQYDQFEIDTYPKMEIFSASEEIEKMIEKMAAKKTSEEETDDHEDYGYIFEIDLT